MFCLSNNCNCERKPSYFMCECVCLGLYVDAHYVARGYIMCYYSFPGITLAPMCTVIQIMYYTKADNIYIC